MKHQIQKRDLAEMNLTHSAVKAPGFSSFVCTV